MEERGAWYRAEIRERDHQIAELEERLKDANAVIWVLEQQAAPGLLTRIASMEQQLKDAEDLLGDALQWATEWRDESWFKKVQDWLAARLQPPAV